MLSSPRAALVPSLLALTTLTLMLEARVAYSQEDNQPPAGFQALFNGKDLSGWHGMNMSPYKLAAMSDEERAAKRAADLEDVQAHWTVENGELVNDGHGVYLTTDEELGDIELWIDYKTVPRADSGLYLRATPQVQIWDYTEEAKWKIGADRGSGGLWNNKGAGKHPAMLADKPFGEWNRFHIIQVGQRTTVWLNGKRVVDHAPLENYWKRDAPLLRKGPLQLQTHGGEIRWRNIFVRKIPASEANEMLSSKNHDGFESIFNGKDLTGWSGATDGYEVVDGTLRCKKNNGGRIFTEQEYGDFIFRLEFQLPPAGNNGLAIRYPGNGDPAYTGMCELQVLDSEHEKYAKLDARQYHASAYGMAAAHRGYLRPTGEWNFQEVTVKGSTIRVELNGSLILDTDLSLITEYLGNRPHPGKDLKQGHLGFAGHGDAVSFRNLSVKKL